jgi:hypothetical protein
MVKAWSTHNRHLSIYLYLQTPQTPLGIYDLKYHHLSGCDFVRRNPIRNRDSNPSVSHQSGSDFVRADQSTGNNKLESYWYIGISISFFLLDGSIEPVRPPPEQRPRFGRSEQLQSGGSIGFFGLTPLIRKYKVTNRRENGLIRRTDWLESLLRSGSDEQSHSLSTYLLWYQSLQLSGDPCGFL